MRRTARTPFDAVTFTPLTGGINTALDAHRLQDGEMIDCLNFCYELGTKTLVPRGGLIPMHQFSTNIHALYCDNDTNIVFVFLTDRTVYRIAGTNDPVLIGTLSGARIPTCAKFQNKLYIASGDRLQVYDYEQNVAACEGAPICDLIFVRSGRLCAALTGSDRIRYSTIGDGADWISDADDQSSAGWIDIGYGDSGLISAIVPLASDLIVFKTNGRIYQFCADGSPDDWRVTELATDAPLRGIRCATHLQGNVVYLSDRGLVSLAATADYGNLAASDIGDRFASLLQDPSDDARFFPLKRRGLLLIRPHSDKRTLIAYHSALGSATRLTFADAIESVIETPSTTLIASGRTLYRWDKSADTDDNAPIDYRIELRHLKSPYPLHLTGLYTDLTSAHRAPVTFTASDGERTLTTTLLADRRTTRRTNHTARHIAPTLSSSKPFTPREITIFLSTL